MLTTFLDDDLPAGKIVFNSLFSNLQNFFDVMFDLIV